MPRACPCRARISMSRWSGAEGSGGALAAAAVASAPAGVAAVKKAIRPSRSSVSAATSNFPVRRARLDISPEIVRSEPSARPCIRRRRKRSPAVNAPSRSTASGRGPASRVTSRRTSESMESIARAAPVDGAAAPLAAPSAFNRPIAQRTSILLRSTSRSALATRPPSSARKPVVSLTESILTSRPAPMLMPSRSRPMRGRNRGVAVAIVTGRPSAAAACASIAALIRSPPSSW